MTVTPSDAVMHPVLMGVNHLTSDVALRDRLLLKPDRIRTLGQAIREAGQIAEVVILSTCHRCEFHAVGRQADATRDALTAAWSGETGVSAAEIAAHAYTHTGLAAIRHLYRVSCSLDSLVLGESQVFGQVKDAFFFARENGFTGLHLNHVFRAAIEVGKRVRTETAISEGAVSISYAAVELARKVLGKLEDKIVGIIGAGEMAELAAQHLMRAGARKFIVFNRSAGNAETLAAKLNGEVCLLANMLDQLHRADIIISATDAPHTILSRQQVAHAVHQRQGNRMFLIDISAPRDIDPAVAEIANAYLFTIDDLKQVVRENELRRQDSVAQAERIIEQELTAMQAWFQGLEIRPTIRQLREKYEAIAQREVERAARNFSDADRAQLEQFSRGLLNKFLHAPLTRLKEIGENGDGLAAVRLASELFALNDTPPAPAAPAEPPSAAP